MSSNFKWNPQGFRDLEKEVQKHLQRQVAPKVQAEQLDPLSRELSGLSRTLVGKPETEIREAVKDSFRRYGLEPGDVSEIAVAIHAGEAIPTIKTHVPPVCIDPPK